MGALPECAGKTARVSQLKNLRGSAGGGEGACVSAASGGGCLFKFAQVCSKHCDGLTAVEHGCGLGVTPAHDVNPLSSPRSHQLDAPGLGWVNQWVPGRAAAWARRAVSHRQPARRATRAQWVEIAARRPLRRTWDVNCCPPPSSTVVELLPTAVALRVELSRLARPVKLLTARGCMPLVTAPTRTFPRAIADADPLQRTSRSPVPSPLRAKHSPRSQSEPAPLSLTLLHNPQPATRTSHPQSLVSAFAAAFRIATSGRPSRPL